VTPVVPALSFRVLGELLRLLEPGALRLLLAVAAAAALAGAALWRRRAALLRAAGPLAPRLAPTAGMARPAGRLSLSVLGLALMVLALSRPQCGSRTELTRRMGLDLVIALDVSRSMLARDVGPDRLSRARLELSKLLDGLGGDRVGLVLFAGRAFPACPLTSDLEALRVFLREAGPSSVPEQGTDLAAALQAAREVLDAEQHGARSRVVLLVSDGEDQGVGSADAAAVMADAGIRVYALAVGGREGAPIPLTDASGDVTGYKMDRRGETVVTRLDEATLAALAAKGNGEVFEVARPDRGVNALRTAIDRLTKTELAGRASVSWEERYALLAFPAFLSLLGAILLPEARRRRP
jgi:Ca-activated chloride channel family protein